MSKKIRNQRCNCCPKNKCQTIKMLVRKFLLMKKRKRKSNKHKKKYSNKKKFRIIPWGILWGILVNLLMDAFKLTDTGQSIIEALRTIMTNIGL